MEKPALRVVEGGSMDKQKALQAALDQIDKNFGKGSIMRLGANDKRIEVEAILDGSLGLDIALGIGGCRAARGRDLRAGVLRQDHAVPAGAGGGPEEGRHLRLRRRRACARSGLCRQARRQGRGPADLAARRWRAGAGNRRHAGALGRHRRAGGRLGGRA
jgi:hypothetical protein